MLREVKSKRLRLFAPALSLLRLSVEGPGL